MRSGWTLVAAIAACASPGTPASAAPDAALVPAPVPAPAPAPVPVPVPVATAVPVPVPAAADAGVTADAAPAAAATAATPATVDETFPLAERKPHATRSGPTWTLSYQRHKQYADGTGVTAVYGFTVTHDGKRHELEARTDARELYAEGVLFDQLYVITGHYGAIRVELRAGKPPRPLSEERAHELAMKRARAKGLPEADGGGHATENGTLRVTGSSGNVPVWGAVVGRYTRRVISISAGSGE